MCTMTTYSDPLLCHGAEFTLQETEQDTVQTSHESTEIEKSFHIAGDMEWLLEDLSDGERPSIKS